MTFTSFILWWRGRSVCVRVLSLCERSSYKNIIHVLKPPNCNSLLFIKKAHWSSKISSTHNTKHETKNTKTLMTSCAHYRAKTAIYSYFYLDYHTGWKRLTAAGHVFSLVPNLIFFILFVRFMSWNCFTTSPSTPVFTKENTLKSN